MDYQAATSVIGDAKEKMTKAVSHAQGEFSGVRSGRAAPALVEKLKVDYFGTEIPLQQLAGISVPEARLITINPYDKGALPSIEKAIQNSDLGINPSNDGQIIRLTFPPLTEERRKELVKLVKHKAEEARVAIRNLRRTSRTELDSLEIGSDELERAEKELDKATHDYVAEIDQMVQHKERELLEV